MGEPGALIPISNAGHEIPQGSTSTTKTVFSLLKRLPVGRLIEGSASIARGVAGQLRRFLARYGHVNRSDSPRPTGDQNDQVGTHPQNISQVSNGAPAQVLTAISQSEQEKEKEKLYEKLYVPQKFALGPLYHRPDSDSESIKDRLIGERDKDCHFEELVVNMRADGFMSEVRAWYTRLQCPLINEEGRLRKLDLYNNDELARMMARDGLFLLEFLRSLPSGTSNASHFTRRPSEISTSPSWPADVFFRTLKQQYPVQEDVMRIVNQIPFFVLKCILQWEAVRDKDKDEANKQAANTDQVLQTLLKHASLKLSPIEYDSDSHDSHVKARVPRSDSHLLEFVYEDIISSSGIKSPYKWRRKSKSSVRVTLPRAVQLTDKGVEFAPNTGLLSDIRFVGRNGKLYLPAIKMDGKTEALLTNMVIFEGSKQGHGQASQPLTSYMDLMERLIDNDKDVQALRDGGVIQCDLSTNQEVADVWNRMRTRKVLPDSKEFKYEPIDYAINDVIRFYKSKWRTIPIQIHRKYFSNPWSGISLAYACILLGLTIFQTCLAWEQLHKP